MTKTQLLHKVRMFCSECMGGARASEGVWPVRNPTDIETCSAPECVWFRYRFGRDPEKRVESASQVAARLRNLRGQKFVESTISPSVVSE